MNYIHSRMEGRERIIYILGWKGGNEIYIYILGWKGGNELENPGSSLEIVAPATSDVEFKYTWPIQSFVHQVNKKLYK